MAWDVFERTGIQGPFLLAVAADQVPGFHILDKYGRNEDAGTQRVPVWDGGNATYTYSVVPEGYRLYSDDNTATNAIEIEVLDTNYATTLVSAVLTGTTPVNIGTYYRSNRMYNVEPGRTIGILGGYVHLVGSGDIAAGTPAAITMLRSKITTPYEQTHQSIFSVPANQDAFIMGMWGGLNSQGGVSALAMDLELWVGGTSVPMRNKRTVGFSNLGNNPAIIPWGVPLKVDARSDIELRSVLQTTGKDVAGGFYGILVDR